MSELHGIRWWRRRESAFMEAWCKLQGRLEDVRHVCRGAKRSSGRHNAQEAKEEPTAPTTTDKAKGNMAAKVARVVVHMVL